MQEEGEGTVGDGGRGRGGSWAVLSGLESVPLGDVGAWPSEHVFPVLHLCWSALP